MVPYLENTVAHGSILTILSISFERYYATCRPLEVLYTCTTKRTIKIIISVWVCSLLSTCPFLFMSFLDDALFYDNTRVKVCRTPIDDGWKQSYVVSTIFVFFILPLLTLSVLYYTIAKQLTKDKNIHNKDTSFLRRTSQQYSSRHQVIYMLIVIIVLFFLCLLPIRVVTLWYVYSSTEDKHILGLEGYLNLICFARIMLYANSAVNPLIYNIVSTRFRGAFLRTVGIRMSLVEMRKMSINKGSVGSYRMTFSSKTDSDGSKISPDCHEKCLLKKCNTLQ